VGRGVVPADYLGRVIELQPTDIAHGGEAVARVDGKAHFVAGAMPGERVEGEVVRDKGSWARVELGRVLDPSPQRVDPPCRHFGDCGGCEWQFADYDAQLDWKRSIVIGQLSHLGRIDDPPVRPTVAAAGPYGYRNRMDFVVEGGRPALRRRRSREAVPIDECLLMESAMAELFARLGDLGEARKVTLRVAVTSGESLVVVDGMLPPDFEEWGCQVSRRSHRGLRPIVGTGAIQETVAGFPFRITGDAFFQNNTAGAEILVALAAEALEPEPHETLLDGYAGGGLFGVIIGRSAGRLLAIESNRLSADDLAHNAAEAGLKHRAFRGRFASTASALDESWDLAVVDPPRDGLGPLGVDAVTSAGPRAIAYVSCDPASLARDCRHLAEAGYSLQWAAPVDMFPQTSHIETVASFARTTGTSTG